MTLQLSTNGATHLNTGALEGAPAVVVSATGVTFTNLSNGLVSASQSGQPAVRLTQGGNTVINRVDGVIASYAGNEIAIEGSAGADMIDNAGVIAGRVLLAGGADTYILRHSPSTPTNVDVDLGDGDDTARFIIVQTVNYMAPQLAGGSGFDVLHLDGPIGQLVATGVTGFERLVIANAGNSTLNLDGLSGLSEMSIAQDSRISFIASHNPLVDLAISGGFITLANGSTVRSVTGSAGTDYLELGFLKTAHRPVTTSIDLGAGDDWLYLTLFDATQVVPGLPAVVQGGAGYDRINLSIPTGETLDMAKFSGFEEVDTGTFTSTTSQVRLINLGGYQRVIADSQGSLTIGQTNAPGLMITPAGQGTLTIEQTASVGSIGYPAAWGTDWLKSAVAQLGQGSTVFNSGTIAGDVQLGLGADLYDGTGGKVGGTVFGYAGNDTIKGGAGNEAIEGGYGADTISGGGGADRIDGGAGSDSLTGGAGADTFVFAQRGIGDDTIHDFTPGDRIDLSGIGIPDFATLQRFMVQAGSDVLITLGYASASETILIRSATLAALGAADFVFNTSAANRFENGTAGDDVMFGGAGLDNLLGGNGTDRLLGGAGNDLLDGGTGADEMIGGDGNDAYFIDNAGDTIIETAGTGGSDTVFSTISYTLGEALEALNLTGSAPIDGTGGDGRNSLVGNGGNNVLRGRGGDDDLSGQMGNDTLEGGSGNDFLDGGSGVDTAVLSGNRSAYTVTQTATGSFSVTGPDGTDALTNIEYLQFADQTIRLYPGSGTIVDFNANPATYMTAIRDFDGNDVGAAADWKRIGSADVNGDGDVDQILVNRTIGRFAEVGTAPDGKVYFSDYSWGGETRVVGIYIDPLVQSGQVEAGGPFDSQRRFQNDLFIENINRVLGAGDYDKDGLQEVYFALTDGTAYLHAYMHADGNIRYANYQSQQQVIGFLSQNGWASSTYDGWFA